MPGDLAGAQRTIRPPVWVLACVGGASVANLYLLQPLIPDIADDLHVSSAAVAGGATLAQLGYAIGLVVLLPLADVIPLRWLSSAVAFGAAASLSALTLAQGAAWFCGAVLLVGVASVAAQIAVVVAAESAATRVRGSVVGQVMTGLLLGVMLARTSAGLIGGAIGWRGIVALSAALSACCAIGLWRLVPQRPRAGAGADRTPRPEPVPLMRLVAGQPLLRYRMVGQALLFAAFCSYWASIALELSEGHGLGGQAIGVFALIAVGGPVAATYAGRLSDRGLTHRASGVSLAVAVGALALAAASGRSVWLLAVAGLALDAAVQGHQVLSQGDIYRLTVSSRGRITALFQGSVFLAGALGGAASALMFEHVGWAPTMAATAVLPVAGLVWWALLGRRAGSAAGVERSRADA